MLAIACAKAISAGSLEAAFSLEALLLNKELTAPILLATTLETLLTPKLLTEGALACDEGAWAELGVIVPVLETLEGVFTTDEAVLDTPAWDDDAPACAKATNNVTGERWPLGNTTSNCKLCAVMLAGLLLLGG